FLLHRMQREIHRAASQERHLVWLPQGHVLFPKISHETRSAPRHQASLPPHCRWIYMLFHLTPASALSVPSLPWQVYRAVRQKEVDRTPVVPKMDVSRGYTTRQGP